MSEWFSTAPALLTVLVVVKFSAGPSDGASIVISINDGSSVDENDGSLDVPRVEL